MIFYVKKCLTAFNMLKEYAKKHSEDAELQEIFNTFGESFGYTASGEDKLVKD